ncbi:MAG TPA: dethiobiotin synthase [Candidatus Binatia bacterium]|nr:dethiobiotin synthase [Candidatus Binatia bacterium]
MTKGIFITGTDTGVGKTLLAASLAAFLRDRGYRVGVMKPAETGCPDSDGTLIPQDALRLKEAAGCAEPIETICPYSFAEPLAPSIAAERSNRKIDVDLLLSTYGEISAKYDVTLVEGAGGLMAPLLPSYTYADFARVLKLPVLVVAANKLGVINHLLLTLEHASCRGLKVLGYVLNRISNENSLAAETNREVLFGLTGVPCLGELPFIEMAGTQKTFPVDLFESELDMRLIEPILSPRSIA